MSAPSKARPLAAHREATPLREQILTCLFRHQVAHTGQLHRLLYPTPRPRADHLRRCLRNLRADGLVIESSRAHHHSLWTLSAQGSALVSSWPPFASQRTRWRSRLDNQRTAHALTTTRTCLAFLDDARARGDEFHPLDWRPEVRHPLHDGAAVGERSLVADAVMRYTRTAPSRQLLRAFVEIDRATESPERLAAKILTFARFYRHRPSQRGSKSCGVPAWQELYPRFPRVLFVLSNAGPRAQYQRITDLQMLARQHPLASTFAAEVPLGVAVLEEMEKDGPSADVWVPLARSGGRCGWMDL
ncbi:replication-relaxation family protein [Streptomyces smyrnaeus]|uniref:Replication-relaxation family protein n=1 Tax=Streptomyces smyrnaeus TaxID=1387713 RepID=A0ABS3Y660_9ACTN|nr:replication-relaxation family protein [Streptomyces smyrnaeus]MBO8203148.1 replication-relaxation family protein [Streptomyces smyrnaeus]